MFKSVVMYNHNKTVRKYSNEIGLIDCIRNYDLFKEYLIKNPIRVRRFTFEEKKSYAESITYGHYDSIAKYSGLSRTQIKYFPIIEHGVDFWETVNPFFFPRACQGPYNKTIWKKSKSGIPLYQIGPLVSYADCIYSEEEIIHLKEKLGKTLVVVPAHTYEFSKNEYDTRSFVNQIMNRYKKEYDSIIIMAYWADVKYPLFDMFKHEGAILMSSGFRSDINFISRQKTILMLADTVVGNQIGTFIGYAYELGKKVEILQSDIKLELTDSTIAPDEAERYLRNTNELLKAFDTEEPDPVLQNKLCEKFWGHNIKRKPEFFCDLYEINKLIIKKSKGNLNKIPNVVESVLQSDLLNDRQKIILKESL